MSSAVARRSDAERRLRRFQDAIAAGLDPTALIEPMTQAQADRATALAEIESLRPRERVLDDDRLREVIVSFGDVRPPDGRRTWSGS